MSIADKEQRPRRIDGKIYRYPADKATVIHIPAILARRRGGDGLVVGWTYPEAAQHGGQWELECAQLRQRFQQRGCAGRAVNLPACRHVVGQVVHGGGVQHIRSQHRPVLACVAIGVKPVQVQHERIAWLRAIDIKRAGLRVAACTHFHLILILGPCVYGGGDDGIAAARAAPAHGDQVSCSSAWLETMVVIAYLRMKFTGNK